MSDLKNIVIAYDGSDASTRALERAAALARAFGSQLIVTSVAPVTTNIGRSAGPVDATDPPETHYAELEDARRYLEGQSLTADFVPAIGHPAETIAQVAEEREADLVVIGTGERNILERLLGQSVSGAVAHRVHCDVLIVH